jgi:hypothetical protein
VLLSWANVAVMAQAHDEQTTAAYYIVGLGTPVGVSGTELVQRFGANFEMSVGAGLGLEASLDDQKINPFQWAAMPRLMFGDRDQAFTLGLGASGGYLRHDDYVVWVNAEVGGEWWSAGRFGIRYFAGYGHGCGTTTSHNIPYGGIGFGLRF